jgi:hypothetical protein
MNTRAHVRRLRLHPGGYRLEETLTEERQVMISWKKNPATLGKLMIFGLLLASLLIATFSAGIAGAAVSPGRAFAWGDNSYGKLGNGLTGGAKNVPAAVSDSGVSRA